MEPLIVILIIAIIILLILYTSSKFKENSLQKEFELLKSEHKFDLERIEKTMNAEITNKAGDWLKEWKENELDSIRLEHKKIAKREALVDLEEWKDDNELSIRSDAINRSQSVIVGKVIEHLIPYLPKFNYNPKDVRFFGDPIDLIVFDGLNDGYIKEIVFIEVKTGKTARLSKRQQDIRDAICERPIKWVSMKVDTDKKTIKSPIKINKETHKAKGKRAKKYIYTKKK